MRCEEIMKKDVKCVSPRDTVEDAAALMRDEKVGFLPVCDESRKVLGTLTDRDIAVRLVASKRPASSFVEDIMSREVVACRPSEDTREALRLMAENHKSRIMCCDEDGAIVGVISLSDIAQHEKGALETLRQVSEREVHA
jgi:CBS domain-containing protein